MSILEVLGVLGLGGVLALIVKVVFGKNRTDYPGRAPRNLPDDLKKKRKEKFEEIDREVKSKTAKEILDEVKERYNK